MLRQLLTENVVLALFNLIPIPPLDGSRIVMGLLPPHLVAPYAALERYGMIIIFVLLCVGGIRMVIYPIAGALHRLLLGF